MEAAFLEIEEFGVGDGAELLRWYRVIEAESITRRKSQTIEVTDWLSLEFVPEELMGLESEVARWALESCDEVATRIGWTHSAKTLLSILAEETDGPWAANPYGYCVSKEPYEKICLPNYLLDDSVEFCQAVAHEYAHVISTDIAEDYAPRWVEEAVSVLVERHFDRPTWEMFCDEPETWLSERELEFVLTDRSDDEAKKEDIWRAYQQAGWIGRYLADLRGEALLGQFLQEIANETPSTNILRSLKRQDRTEHALKRVYSLSKRALFANAYRWMCDLDSDRL